MSLTIEEQFYDTIKPTLYLARAFALVPFSLSEKKLMRTWLPLSVAISGYYFFGVSRVYISMFNNPILPKFEKMMLMLQVTATGSVTMFSWLVNHFKFRKFISVVEQVIYIEELLVLQGFDRDLKRRRKIQYHFTFWISFFSLQNVMDNVILGENVMGLFIIYTIAMLTLSHFLLLVCVCHQHYGFINDRIKEIGGLSPEGLTDIEAFAEEACRDKWAQATMNFQEAVVVKHSIKVLAECHSALYEVCHKINKYFGLQILAVVTAQILNVTSICYFVPAVVIDQSDRPHDYMIISIKSVLFISLFAFIQLWFMAYVCSSTSEEANFTGILVHGVMNQPKFSCVYEQVIGVVITYIVILIQFQMS